MARLRRATRWLARWLGRLAIALILVAVAAVAFLGYTDAGRRVVLKIARPLVEEQLTGKLRIGRLDGGLLSGLELRDVELEDAEGQVAVAARRLAVRYRLWPLLSKRFEAGELVAEGLVVDGRYLTDGRLNLAALARPSEKAPDPAAKPSEWQVHVAQIRLDTAVTFRPQAGPKVLEKIALRIDLEGSAAVEGARVKVDVTKLDVGLLEPLAASLHVGGGLRVDSALALDGIRLSLEMEGAALERLFPAGDLGDTHLLGRWRADVKLGGPLHALAASVGVYPPRGTISVEARADAVAETWNATVMARDLDPAAAWSGAPHALVGLRATAEGRKKAGTFDVAQLEVALAGGHVEVHGKGTLDGEADGVVTVDMPSLARLRELQAPGLRLPHLGGALKAHARIGRHHHVVTVDGSADGRRLVVPGAKIEHVALKVKTTDLETAELDARAEGVAAGGQNLAAATVEVFGDHAQGHARVTARAVDGSALALRLHGTPQWKAGRPVGFDGLLDELRLEARRQEAHLLRPAKLHLGDQIAVAGLAFGFADAEKADRSAARSIAQNDQQIVVDGKLDPATRVVDAQVRATAIDLRQVLALASPPASPDAPPRVPRSRLDVTVKVKGKLPAPEVNLLVAGRTEAWEPLALDAFTHRVAARWSNGRVVGDVVSSGGAGKIASRFDVAVPLNATRLEGEVSLDLPALERFAKLLPPRLSSLRGGVALRVRLAGSLRQPEVAVTLEAPAIALGELRPSLSAQLALKAGRFEATGDVKLGREGGGATVGGLGFHATTPLVVDLLDLPADLLDHLVRDSPLSLDVALRDVDVARVPWASLGLTPPLAAGVVGGKVSVAGTGLDPAVKLDLHGRGLPVPPLRAPVDASVRGDWGGAEARLDVTVSQPDRFAPLATAKGTAGMVLADLVAGKPWRDPKIALAVDLPGFDLGELPSLNGHVDGKITVAGTIGRPEAQAKLHVLRLRVEEVKVGDLELAARGTFDGSAAAVNAGVHQPKGGDLEVDAALPLDEKKPLKAVLTATRFDLGFLAAVMTSLRRVDAKLNAALTLEGTRLRPTLAGTLRVKDAVVETDDAPAPYRDIELELNASDGEVDVRKLAVKFQKGRASAGLKLKLDGYRPLGATGLIEAKAFPVIYGEMVGSVDARVKLDGEARDATSTAATITVEEGTLRLPKIEGQGSAQSSGALADVVFVDRAGVKAREAEAARAAAASSTSTTRLNLKARVPGPFYLRGPDVNADVMGDVQLDVAGGRTRLVGTVEVPRGTVQISERPYRIAHARASFDGTANPDPDLDVRLTRDIQGTTLIITVTGTAKAPKLSLSCDPPIFGQTELITIIATGDDGSKADPADKDKSIEQVVEQKVVGAVAGLLLGRLKEEFGGYVPVEVLKFDLNYQGMGNIPRARLEVGKYILDNLFVSYVYQYAPQTSQRRRNSHEAHLEYSFLKDFSLLGTFGDAAVGAVDFYWNYRF